MVKVMVGIYGLETVNFMGVEIVSVLVINIYLFIHRMSDH